MGGKGKRRREKNFQAAHGGYARLPPPPKAKELDALPTKLRRIMEFTNPASTKKGPLHIPRDAGHERGRGGTAGEKKANSKDARSSTASLKMGENIGKKISIPRVQEKDAIGSSASDEVTKRKRKRKEVNDLRFQNLDQGAASSRRKERKKEYFEAKKKKHKKSMTDDIRDFPGHEEIKFGEVVQAPPKLSFPKALKASVASQERVRMQAVEAYRNRRGWVSRPGVQLPTFSETLSS